MQYFSFISNRYMCNNNLKKAILSFLEDNDRLVIEENGVEKFKARIIAGIENIVENYPRCNPIVVDWHQHFDKDLGLQTGGVICCFHLYQSK